MRNSRCKSEDKLTSLIKKKKLTTGLAITAAVLQHINSNVLSFYDNQSVICIIGQLSDNYNGYFYR